MALGSAPLIPEGVQNLLQSIIGKTCTFQRAGTDKSLFIGFGDIDHAGLVPHADNEIVLYDCSWRFCRGSQVLLGRSDVVSSQFVFQEQLEEIRLGMFVGLSHISQFDI